MIASYDFLLIMLIGIIINNMYLLILTKKQSSVKDCLNEYLFNNVVSINDSFHY